MERRWRSAKHRYFRHRAAIRATRCGTAECNRRLGAAIARKQGYGPGDIACLETIGEHESGWDEQAINSGSGAGGIPQALPPSKMGPGAIGSGWRVAAKQIRWMLSYLRERYGSPCGGWEFWRANSWY